jgi:hypothetical protein
MELTLAPASGGVPVRASTNLAEVYSRFLSLGQDVLDLQFPSLWLRKRRFRRKNYAAEEVFS